MPFWRIGKRADVTPFLLIPSRAYGKTLSPRGEASNTSNSTCYTPPLYAAVVASANKKRKRAHLQEIHKFASLIEIDAFWYLHFALSTSLIRREYTIQKSARCSFLISLVVRARHLVADPTRAGLVAAPWFVFSVLSTVSGGGAWRYRDRRGPDRKRVS